MKKVTAILLVLVLLFTTSATTLAATGATDVTVTVNSAQISVTVPADFSITALVDGGAATVPTNYKLTNLSAIPVKVDSIAVTLNNSTDWAFKATPIEAGTAPTGTGVNDIYLTVNGQVMAAQTATTPTDASAWNIPASSDLDLPLVCSTSKLDQTTSEADLITITYVISAGSH